MPAATHSDLRKLLGKPAAHDDEQADEVLSIVTTMARNYTRGNGFDEAGVPNEDIRAVILTASARLLSHPRQLGISETLGPQSAYFREGFQGWSLAELFVLNNYRVRAA